MTQLMNTRMVLLLCYVPGHHAHMKHNSFLAPAIVATFAGFPYFSSFAIFCFILLEPLSA
ncbi:MAG: hypothetical protein ACI4NI_04860 [Candidatus Ornithospirochaeta sp.]